MALGAEGRRLLRQVAGAALLLGIPLALYIGLVAGRPCGNVYVNEFATCADVPLALGVGGGSLLLAALLLIAARKRSP